MSLLLCQEGKRTWFLKVSQEDVGIGRRPVGRGWDWEVEEGSQGWEPGVTRAFRFWEIVSSTAVLEVRRKSRVAELV